LRGAGIGAGELGEVGSRVGDPAERAQRLDARRHARLGERAVGEAPLVLTESLQRVVGVPGVELLFCLGDQAYFLRQRVRGVCDRRSRSRGVRDA
jgi:hypothetical protein